MSVREKLQPASFRGIPFLVSSENSTGGKKIATHEFVNNDKRYTEELGKLPPTFTIQAIVHGDDAIAKRFDLERVLNLPGLGDLVHPVYGTIKVKSTTFSVSSNQRDIGRFDFSINFESSEANITASPDVVTASAVSSAAVEARTAINDALESGFIPPQIPDTVDSTGATLTSVLDSVDQSISTVINPVQDGAAEFTKVVNEAKTGVYSIVQEGTKVRSTLEGVYNSAISVAQMPQELYASWKDLTEFALDVIPGKINTVYRVTKENNNSLMDEHTRINALINLFESTAYSDFNTDQDLQNAVNLLDDTFNDLLRKFDEEIDSELNIIAKDPTVRQKMSSLRTITRKVLERKEKNAWKIVSIDPGLSSMALVSYRFYGNLDNLDLIKTLNGNVNWSNSDQTIQAVSQ